MSIVWDWSDPWIELYGDDVFVNAKCALSGDKLEPPFMLWSGEILLAINAKSIGGGFVLDVVMSSYIGDHVSDKQSLGVVRDMFVKRMRGMD